MPPRKEELYSLEWGDIDWEGNAIHIKGHKTRNSHRWVTVAPEFMDRLRKWREIDREQYPGRAFIIARGDNPQNSMRRSWESAKRKAGAPTQIRLYDIQHFYITWAIYLGANPKELADRCGRTDLRMISEVYLHTVEQMLRIPSPKLPDFYGDTLTDAEKERPRQERTARTPKPKRVK